jgi:hypothetical protein
MVEVSAQGFGEMRQDTNADTWLAKKLATLEALYRRYGRDGLKDQSIVDVGLLLSSKELQLRDTAKSRDLSEDQKAENRQVELEVKDLTAYVKGQLAGFSLSDLRSFRRPDRPRQNEPQKRRDVDWER